MPELPLVPLCFASFVLALGLLVSTPCAVAPASAGEALHLAHRSSFASDAYSTNNGRDENGFLELSIPTNATATFEEPTILDTYSVTTGTLGNVQVNDTRWITNDGWDLSVDVATFVSGQNQISNSSLGLVPTVVSGLTTASGITASTATVAGRASYPIVLASGAKNAGLGTTGVSVLNAALTFVAPRTAHAGVYLSTITFTLTSK